MLIKKESKYTSPMKHMLINDAGIGSNRIVMLNNYLNNYNYFNKNNIKMLEFHKRKYLENKLKAEEYKREKSIPELSWATSYYLYFNKSNNDYIKDDKNNNELKKAEINYLQDLEENALKYHSRNNKIRKTCKIYDDLMRDLNSPKNEKKDNLKNYYSTEFNSKEKNKNNNKRYYNFQDEKTDYDFDERKKRIYNVKCKVIFGKTLSTDHRITLKQNKKNSYFNKRNKMIIKNKANLQKKYDNLKYSNYPFPNSNSSREQTNKDLNTITTNYFNKQLENKEKKYFLKDNNKNELLPLIK